MKSLFWKTKSKKPKKQRIALFKAPLHKRHKLVSAPLSPELRAKYGRRSFPVRKGDTVLIMRGDYAGYEGKVLRVDLKKYRIHIEGVTRRKADGTIIYVPIHPSKVMITKLDLSDPRRKEALEKAKVEVK
ncbi:MAG: 50S ribosomal protein L24 [archaeon GB-1867-005]|nr:50S ribosomal protein L24 [Candidatus Culexmicrobium cathedralense]